MKILGVAGPMDHLDDNSTIGHCRETASRILERAGLRAARLDADYLLSEALGRDKAWLFAHSGDPCPPRVRHAFAAWVSRRAAGEPVQYILGKCNFWKDVFRVTPAVLIPRPETELLVEIGAGHLQGQPAPAILDLAAGSGCVGLSLLRELPGAHVTAADISPAALALAAENAGRLGLAGRWTPVTADGFSAFAPAARWDYIAVNPPYVADRDMPGLPAEVGRNEPGRALRGGPDGLDFYRAWIPEGLRRLAPGGALAMEFGCGQWDALEQLLRSCDASFQCYSDLAGIPRTFVCTSA